MARSSPIQSDPGQIRTAGLRFRKGDPAEADAESQRTAEDVVGHSGTSAPQQRHNEETPEETRDRRREALHRIFVERLNSKPRVPKILRPDCSVVYFIGPVSGGRIKIGTTTKLYIRLSMLQRHSPVEMGVYLWVPGGRVLEQSLHRELARCRCWGEWFDLDAAAVARINEMVRTENERRLREHGPATHQWGDLNHIARNPSEAA